MSGYRRVALALALGLLSGCVTSERRRPQAGGESHFLAACARDADCSGGEVCGCGICTNACEGGCGDALCLSVEDPRVSDACAQTPAPAAAICVAACDADPDCAEGLACVEGACAQPLDACEDGVQGAEERGIDCGGPCDACPEGPLRVSLTWETPGDPTPGDTSGADLDLHLLHPNAEGAWGDPVWDAHSLNHNPDWGAPGEAADDPQLDIDDVDGEGPENINLARPEEGRVYRVGVVLRDDQGMGPSLASVRIYVGERRVAERLARRLDNTERGGDLTLWEAFEIAWPLRVTQIDAISVIAPP